MFWLDDYHFSDETLNNLKQNEAHRALAYVPCIYSHAR